MFGRGRDHLRGYRALKIGLAPPREELYRRIDERTAQMFAGGLVEEVRGILARGFSRTAKPFESHGYRQALQLLEGELSWKEAIFYAQRNTRRYAKRQMTWFRREAGIEWLSGFGSDPEVERAASASVRKFLIEDGTSRN
jgi:tRNA dimethylallyltransferase